MKVHKQNIGWSTGEGNMWNEYINFFCEINTVLGLSTWAAGKLADASLNQIAEVFRKPNSNFEKDYYKLQLKILGTCIPGFSKENAKSFEEFFPKYKKEHSLILDDEGLKAFLAEIQIRENDSIVEDFRKKLIHQLANIQGLYNHLTLTILFEIKDYLDSDQKKDESEYEELLASIQQQLVFFCHHDYYQGITSLQPGIYRYIMSQLARDDCKREIINLAYEMTIIMDYFKDKDELIPLARRIEMLIKNDKASFMYYRMRIGCSYSIMQADRTNPAILDEVDANYKSIYDEMINWCVTHTVRDEVYFLKGLYESDYAALLLNRHKLLGEDETGQCLQEALAHHLAGLGYRRDLCEYYEYYKKQNRPGDDKKYTDAKLRYLKSESNVGSCYYQMKEYRKALEHHEMALQGRINLGMDTEMIQTKEYILGCYLKIKSTLSDWERTRCSMFLDDCEAYYRKNGATDKLEKMVKMRRELL